MLEELTQINWQAFSDPEIVARLALQVVLFFFSALFSMSETALFALRETDLARLDHRKPSTAQMLRNLLDEPRQLIVSILCGNELINIAATINLAGIFLSLYSDPAIAALASTLIMLPLLLMFGEITPKTLAVKNPVGLCTHLIGPMISYWVRIVAPLRALIRLVADYITSLIVGDNNGSNMLQADEFQTLVLSAEGSINQGERKLINNLIDASTTNIKSIMVPRSRVGFINADDPVENIIEKFRLLRHRRVPVYKQDRDNIIGVLKDQSVLKKLYKQNTNELSVQDLVQPANYIPDTATISEVADFFKSGSHHMLIVINEFGGIEGIVSADDVFDFLLNGHFHPGFLQSEIMIRENEDGSYDCSGLTPLEILQDRSRISLQATDITTIGGYLLHLAGKLPKVGDIFKDQSWVYEILEMEHLLIKAIRIHTPGSDSLELAYANQAASEPDSTSSDTLEAAK